MSISPVSSGLSVSASVRVTETQDGAVLLDVEQGLCFSINPVGTLIWKRINDGCPPIQIAEHIAETFSISSEEARNDTKEFLDALIEKRLVQDRERKETANRRPGWIAGILPGLWKLVRTNRKKQLG